MTTTKIHKLNTEANVRDKTRINYSFATSYKLSKQGSSKNNTAEKQEEDNFCGNMKFKEANCVKRTNCTMSQ